MWGSLSRADNLVEIVRNIKSIKELKSLKTYLLDSSNTQMLRDSQVHNALMEIPKQIYNIAKEDPIKVLAQIAEHIF
jgi:chaperonin GroEL (HSP60 family)